MTGSPNNAHMREASAFTEPPAFTHAPLLIPLLVFSLILHAAVIGFWPDAAVMIAEPLPAARLAVQLHNNVAGDPRAAAQSAATMLARATPIPATRQRPKQTQDMHTATRMTSHPVIASRPSVAPAARPGAASAASNTPSAAAPQLQTDNQAASDDGGALRERLNSSLQRALIAHFDYPPVARRRGWEGVVQVGLRVEANGQLSRLRLVATSGHALLDRAALQSLGRVGRLPVMDWLQGRQLDMILPVRYQLIDS